MTIGPSNPRITHGMATAQRRSRPGPSGSTTRPPFPVQHRHGRLGAVWRPLSQRVRESARVRLIADNRFVRRIADKPVSTATTRRQTVLIGLIPALVAAGLLVSSWFVIAYYPDTVGGLLALLAIPILLLGGIFIGRQGRS